MVHSSEPLSSFQIKEDDADSHVQLASGSVEVQLMEFVKCLEDHARIVEDLKEAHRELAETSSGDSKDVEFDKESNFNHMSALRRKDS
uniref:Uncharacterized protein n=1 Tax=Caenorhabditis japonica TaxID=281687 RepID=A0A8R1IQJ3_CAEJA